MFFFWVGYAVVYILSTNLDSVILTQFENKTRAIQTVKKHYLKTVWKQSMMLLSNAVSLSIDFQLRVL